MKPPVPRSKKSCPVALQVEIFTVTVPVAPACNPALIVLVVPAASITVPCNPVAFVELIVSPTSAKSTIAYTSSDAETCSFPEPFTPL